MSSLLGSFSPVTCAPLSSPERVRLQSTRCVQINSDFIKQQWMTLDRSATFMASSLPYRKRRSFTEASASHKVSHFIYIDPQFPARDGSCCRPAK